MTMLQSAFDLHGKVALVTGGANGIGAATATVLAEAGAAVVVTDIDHAGATAVAEKIGTEGGKAVSLAVDTRRRASLDAAVAHAVEQFGGLDIMCNIAGVAGAAQLIEAVTESDYDQVHDINVKGVLFGCQAAIPVLKARGGGSIVNVSSTGIDVPAAENGVYAMTKAAVAMLSMTLATELGPFGIRVNTLAPGATITKFSERHLYDDEGNPTPERFDAFLDRMKGFSPLGIVGEAMDQALMILYLVAPSGRYATGNIFRVNGGQSMVW
jgi:3-oxoacyl-[acyl-carrier protein] reductase